MGYTPIPRVQLAYVPEGYSYQPPPAPALERVKEAYVDGTYDGDALDVHVGYVLEHGLEASSQLPWEDAAVVPWPDGVVDQLYAQADLSARAHRAAATDELVEQLVQARLVQADSLGPPANPRNRSTA